MGRMASKYPSAAYKQNYMTYVLERLQQIHQWKEKREKDKAKQKQTLKNETFYWNKF